MIWTLSDIVERAHAWRATGLQLGFTNGVFDLLHVGHLRVLSYAAGLCDLLIVGVDNDALVRQTKGPERPVNSALDRAQMLASIKGVAAVTIFGAGELDGLIASIAPDVLIKGAQYRLQAIVGAQHARRVAWAPMIDGVSTTALIGKARGH